MTAARGKALWFLPLALFAALVLLFASRLGTAPEAVVKSRMVGKPVPEFTLDGPGGAEGLTSADLATGQPQLLNLFASWCLPCAVEAPRLEALKARGITIHGIAVRDQDDATAAFLSRHGNPFARIGMDRGGTAMLGFGASGVPETYVIDGRGIIRHQHLGEVREEDVARLLAELERAR